jgi:hypothetical protein
MIDKEIMIEEKEINIKISIENNLLLEIMITKDQEEIEIHITQGMSIKVGLRVIEIQVNINLDPIKISISLKVTLIIRKIHEIINQTKNPSALINRVIRLEIRVIHSEKKKFKKKENNLSKMTHIKILHNSLIKYLNINLLFHFFNHSRFILIYQCSSRLISTKTIFK